MTPIADLPDADTFVEAIRVELEKLAEYALFLTSDTETM